MRVLAAASWELSWLERRAGCVLTRNARGVKAVDAYGAIRAMVAFDSWTNASAQAHMAAETPIAWRSLLRPAFSYPFIEADKRVLIAVIPAGNERSLRLAKRFGFRETHRVPDGWDTGEDLVLLEMRREDCRHIQGSR